MEDDAPLHPPPFTAGYEEMRNAMLWASGGDGSESFSSALPRTQRDVLPCEAQRGLADTITKRSQCDSSLRATIKRNEWCQEVGDDCCTSSTDVIIPSPNGDSWAITERDGEVPSLSNAQDGMMIEEGSSRRLTLADTITLPKPRMRRPMMGRSRLTARDPVTGSKGLCCPRETISESRNNRQNGRNDCNDRDQCCAGPQFAVSRSERHGGKSVDLSRTLRRDYGPVLSNSTLQLPSTNPRQPISARARQTIDREICSGALCCAGPDFAIREPSAIDGMERDSGFGCSATRILPVQRRHHPETTRTNQRPSANRMRSEEGSYADDDDESPSLVPEVEITEGMTSEEIRKAKSDRRKEQCRINQANYRKRKRAVEKQTDNEIQQLHDEIERLQVKRSITQQRVRYALEIERQSRDPVELVNMVFTKMSPTLDVRQTRAPHRQVDAIVGLGYEEFVSVDELLAQWKYHRSVFDVFEVRLQSVRKEQLGESLVLLADATLRCSIVARPHKHHRDDGTQGDDIVVCPVVQRYVFDARERLLAKIISEVDWLAGLREHSASSLTLASALVA